MSCLDKDITIQSIVRRDPRFDADAYHFVFEALDFTIQSRGGTRRHVSGPEIMDGVRGLALEKFGFMARTVLEHWGVTTTDDFGRIVFNLIGADLLQKTADDSIDDFRGLYRFDEAFDRAFEAALHEVEPA